MLVTTEFKAQVYFTTNNSGILRWTAYRKVKSHINSVTGEADVAWATKNFGTGYSMASNTNGIDVSYGILYAFHLRCSGELIRLCQTSGTFKSVFGPTVMYSLS